MTAVDLQEYLDESLHNMYQETQETYRMELDMFVATDIMDAPFEVTFQKQDGTFKTMTGTLVAPNYEGSPESLFDYCVGLVEKHQVPVWTAQGWRSFIKSSVVSIKMVTEEVV
jgi:hypothetical protein